MCSVTKKLFCPTENCVVTCRNIKSAYFGKNKVREVIFCIGLTTFKTNFIVLFSQLAFLLNLYVFGHFGTFVKIVQRRILKVQQFKNSKFFKCYCQVLFEELGHRNLQKFGSLSCIVLSQLSTKKCIIKFSPSNFARNFKNQLVLRLLDVNELAQL